MLCLDSTQGADVNFITSMVAHRVIDTQFESKSNAIEESKSNAIEESKSTDESKPNEVKADESEKKDNTEVKAIESKADNKPKEPNAKEGEADVNFISSMVSHRVVDPAAMVVPSQQETVAYSAMVWEV